MKVLVAGWFSFKDMGATAGDIIAKDIVCQWLDEMGVKYIVAYAHPLEGILWKTLNPQDIFIVIFVCGPFGNGWPVTEFLEHFAGCKVIGINLSMLQNLNEWNPFDLLLERDSSHNTNPDLTFLSALRPVPLVGIIHVHKQKEYKNKSNHELAYQTIESFINENENSIVRIDTALENNQYGLKTPREVETLIARMDLIITTRLHGTVLAIKNGTPVIPIDPISGGAKISMQVKEISWPILLVDDKINQIELHKAFDFCLTTEAKKTTFRCAEFAKKKLLANKLKFNEYFRTNLT